MKELHGSASAVVPASAEACVQLLRDVDAYPRWYPEVVKEAEVLARGEDGQPTKARAALHVAVGPLTRDFNLVLAITVRPGELVKLARQPHGASDHERFEVTWRLAPEGAGTRIRLQLDANLSVPRLLPIGSIGETIAQGFIDAATKALR
jgi:ribosome-associated toxin RatA of RatAB toxin-antitoxin module